MGDDTADTARTFDDASDTFDLLTETVWGPAGRALAFQLGLRPGDTVLDACCGAGASALPAAAAVGPSGRVHGVDISADLLEKARLIAEARALQNIDFVCADVTTWEAPSDIPAEGYDALAISYGVFFLPDMHRAFARLVGLVRHGGRVGVTVWQDGSMEEYGQVVFDVASHFNADLAERGSLRARTPLHEIDTPDTFEAWLADAGTHSVDVRVLSNLLPATDELCWNLVTGTGYRAALNGLDDEQIAAVRRGIADEVTARGLHTIDFTTLVGTATVRRPPTAASGHLTQSRV
ncbi:MAG TPA: class I SAM-dependent methyltransferase [Rhodococcus sp. (in: high G+C Gram-positive bacteria)]|jgi:ubiquinone/menaquinone biosynthesis C-methylase UbiE|nr:class I SAM-dependent methyltransferase [Rhodococcus sp. (in: high G+C Gram-positive bacteria)]